MTGPQHYAEAERLVRLSQGYDPEPATLATAAAQVHATLALVAATALLGPVAAGAYDDDPDLCAWRAAAGTGGES